MGDAAGGMKNDLMFGVDGFVALAVLLVAVVVVRSVKSVFGAKGAAAVIEPGAGAWTILRDAKDENREPPMPGRLGIGKAGAGATAGGASAGAGAAGCAVEGAAGVVAAFAGGTATSTAAVAAACLATIAAANPPRAAAGAGDAESGLWCTRGAVDRLNSSKRLRRTCSPA